MTFNRVFRFSNADGFRDRYHQASASVQKWVNDMIFGELNVEQGLNELKDGLIGIKNRDENGGILKSSYVIL